MYHICKTRDISVSKATAFELHELSSIGNNARFDVLAVMIKIPTL